MGGREDDQVVELTQVLTSEGVDLGDRLNLVSE